MLRDRQIRLAMLDSHGPAAVALVLWNVGG
jgi:hypothetical protein